MSAKRDSEVVRLEPGEKCPPAEVGDVLFVRGTAAISKLIMLVQPFSHVVCVLDFPQATDAQAHGVVKRSVSAYDDAPRVLVRIGASQSNREEMRAFLESVLEAKYSYGYLTFACVGLAMLTGWKLTFGVAGSSICSGLCAEALVRCGDVFPRPPQYVTPGDLARHLGI